MQAEMHNHFQAYISIIFATVQLAEANNTRPTSGLHFYKKRSVDEGRPLIGTICPMYLTH